MNDRKKKESSFGVKAVMVLAITATLLFVVSLAAYYAGVAGPTRGKLGSLREDGAAMVRSIEEFRAEKGRYPGSLREAGIDAAEWRYGPWEYQLNSAGDAFELSIGDYGEDLFTLSWSSDKGTWYQDT